MMSSRFYSALLLATFILLGPFHVYGYMTIIDNSSIPDPALRKRLVQANADFKANPHDPDAVEILVSVILPNYSLPAVIQTAYIDPDKQTARNLLREYYSVDFLTHILKEGSDQAVYWALWKLKNQIQASDPETSHFHPGQSRLHARKGVVTPEDLTGLLPILRHLVTEGHNRHLAKDILEHMTVEKKQPNPEFLKVLALPDEPAINAGLRRLLSSTNENPLVTREMWLCLENARSNELLSTCLRYNWFFEDITFDAKHVEIIERLSRNRAGSVRTNLRSALSELIRGDAPDADAILTTLSQTEHDELRELIILYKGHRKRHLEDQELQGVPPVLDIPEPSHEGRTLTQWLDDIRFATIAPCHSGASDPYDAAIRKMGEHAIPALVNRFEVADPPYDEEDEKLAIHALGVLGSDAKSACGGLIRISAHVYDTRIAARPGSKTTELKKRKARQAAYALRKIGPDALLALYLALKSEDPRVRFGAAYALSSFRRNAPGIGEALSQTLRDEDVLVRLRAARSLSSLTPDPEIAVAALRDRLGKETHSNVMYYLCQALGNYGPEAVSSIPELNAALQNPSPSVRDSAKRALKKITSPPESTTPPSTK